MKSRIRVIIFGILILGLSFINLLSPSKSFSDRENRFLERLPKFSMEAIIDGKFNEKFQKYTADQFIARDNWISLKTKLDLAMLKQDNGRVYFGQDNFLFDVDKTIDEERFVKNIDKINTFKDNIDIPVDIMLVPTKSTIFIEKLPAKAPIIDEDELLEHIEDSIDEDIRSIPLINLFRSKNSEAIYYKTDHHYTSLGAYYAYHEYMKSLGIEPLNLDYFEREVVSDKFLGSQFRKSNYYAGTSETIEKFIPKEDTIINIIKNEKDEASSLYDEKFLEKSDKYSFFLGGDDAVVDIKTSLQGQGTLLVVKDSFANSLVPFLTNHFERIIVIDERYLNIPIRDYIDGIEIDRILFLKNIRTFYDG